MNWLSHLLLSDATPQFRVGNLLPDLLRLPQLQAAPREFDAGIACHRAIDSFTDAHPIFRRSVARVSPEFRRFGGVYIDVFYDHFLTKNWGNYSRIPLDDFVNEVYASFDDVRDTVPPLAMPILDAMRREDWLRSYGDLRGIETTLTRISRRLRRPFALQNGIRVLETNADELENDFREFFPQLVAHTAAFRTPNK